MNFSQTALELARMRQEELIAEAAQARRLEQRPSTIRRFVGRRVINFPSSLNGPSFPFAIPRTSKHSNCARLLTK